MLPPTAAYLTRALWWLCATVALYLLMNGAQIFETLLVVPAWTAAPPASLGMFQGDHRLDFKAFWIAFHSIHELAFIVALILCWKIENVRNWVLGAFILHLAVRIWTLGYFAPTIIEFQQMAPSSAIDPELARRAAQWRNLNLVRVALFFVANLALFPPTLRLAKMLCATAPSRGRA
jgi:hypothetical protein